MERRDAKFKSIYAGGAGSNRSTARLDACRHASECDAKPARVGGRCWLGHSRPLGSPHFGAAVDWCLNDPNAAHGPVAERLVDPLDQLWNGVLHFKRFCRVDLQMEKRGRGFSLGFRLRRSFCQLRWHREGGERRARYGCPFSKQPGEYRASAAERLSCDGRNEAPDRDRSTARKRNTGTVAMMRGNRHSKANRRFGIRAKGAASRPANFTGM